MSYYPNSYFNYPYNNNGMGQYMQQQPMQMQPMQQQMTQTPPQYTTIQPQQMGLNGKIVDSSDIVKATEVPIGGYGIFPKADLSEIYIKSWNNNGTTSIITYKPIAPEPAITQQEHRLIEGEIIADSSKILDRIGELESKIDSILNTNYLSSTSKKKEVDY